MSFLSGLWNPGNQHVAGQVKGTGFRVDQAAVGTFLPQFEGLSKEGMANENAYNQYMNAMTSSSPTERMAAAAPGIADITAQTEGAKSSIQNMPRGGEKNFLIGQADISKAGQISALLNNLYSQARQQQGQFGAQQVGQSQSGGNLYSGMEGNAANIISGGGAIQNQNNQGMFKTIMDVAAMAAGI